VSQRDFSNRSYLPTYIAEENHIIIPIFIATRITNLTFVTISYKSWDYRDELVWRAAWLYTAGSLYKEFSLRHWGGGLNWDYKLSGVQVKHVKKFTFTTSLTIQ
jgi:hypothetical protein